MSPAIAVIAIYEFHGQVKDAIQKLRRSGFDMRQLSIIGGQRAGDFSNLGGRARYCAEAGAFWRGVWNQLTDSAVFTIPRLGPILAAGPLVAWIAGALEGEVAIDGLSAVGVGLYRFRIPKNSALWMEAALRADNLLVVAHGAASEAERARGILISSGATEVVTHTDGGFAASHAG
jgi:hypothetical protein